MLRFLLIALLLLVPGGLLVLAAFILARSVTEQMRVHQGSANQRFKRAVKAVKWRDVWANAREQLR